MNNKKLMELMHGMYQLPKFNRMEALESNVQLEVLALTFGVDQSEYDSKKRVDEAENYDRKQAVSNDVIVDKFKTYVKRYNEGADSKVLLEIKYFIEIAMIISLELVQRLEAYRDKHVNKDEAV